MNKIILIGRLTRDAEYKQVNGEGSNILSFTLAVNSDFVKEDGTRQVDFIPIVYWTKHGESLQKYLIKGKLLCITGRLNLRSFSNEEGTKKYITQVVAENIKFLESNREKEKVVNE